ncbi:MAG TPA: hypothetical protein VGJ53_04345 [Micromonosporaceae bacterium]|jgi:hypothetical protein
MPEPDPLPAVGGADVGALMRSPRKQLHHTTHAGLLVRPSRLPASHARIDGIVVPTARPASHLSDAMRLASDHGCPILVLCSRDSNAIAAVAQAAEFGANAVAADVTGEEQIGTLSRFATSRLLRGTDFDSGNDLSFKRNLGLALARMAGWERILFLDDDMHDIESNAVSAAASLLDGFEVVGLRNNGFPDNSVLCHAYKGIDDNQDTFIGGGALAVATDRIRGFFPNVYNEDWLFMLASVAERRVAVWGEARQLTYDPFALPRRAQIEEFGDCLAEGLYHLLDTDGTIEGADAAFWGEFIADRRRLIDDTIDAIGKQSPPDDRRARALSALDTSRRSNMLLAPSDFVDYLSHWRKDGELWQAWIERLGSFDGIEKALAEVGLAATVPTPRAIAPSAVTKYAPTAVQGRPVANGAERRRWLALWWRPFSTSRPPGRRTRSTRAARWRPGFMVNSFSRRLARHASNTLTN